MSAKEERKKRDVPAPLQKLLAVDKVVTKKFCLYMEKILPYTQYRKHYKFLEYSCHTLPWLFSTIAALWLLWNEDLFQTQVNLLFGLVLDCFVIAITKAAVRRRRPSSNDKDMFLSIGVDAYSFPSGHVSRAIMVTYIATFITGSNIILVLFLLIWASAVSVSRILLKRHHILDVAGGIFVGLTEGWLLSHLWLTKVTALWLVRYLTDEALNLEGLQDDDAPVD